VSTVERAPLQIRLLGPVDVVRSGTAINVGGGRQRTLLALLALQRGRWLSRDQLIEELFRGEPSEAAETTLRSYVSRLRRVLGESVQLTGGSAGYSLEMVPTDIDATRFEALVADAEEALRRRRHALAADRLRTALALWRGEPFGGLGMDGVLRVEAERLDELRLRAVELRIESELALGIAGELVDELEALVREHPYREAFWRQLMLALYRSERQADALGAYHRARAALDEQLGIEPGEELLALESAILRHEVPAATQPAERHNLPAPVTSFVGREALLSEVEELVGTHRLVTLSGVGGVGKTRLAIEAARRLAATFADGVAFVDLSPLVDPRLLTDQVAAVLDVRGGQGIDSLERLVDHLRDQDLLLVLDNCEHLLAACASVSSRLLATCPSLRILATSRELLGIEGEADVPVPPLGIPTEHEPNVGDSEAVRLFMARARAARPSLPDDDATLEAVGRICADLEGIPLAIELAAARARVLSPSEIGDRLHDRFRFLVSWRRLITARHRTLREAMDWSHDLLDPGPRQLLADLSVFAGGFELDAVEGICVIDGVPAGIDQLQRLVEASLVTVDQGADPTRYGLLETVREYGAEHLEASGRSDDVRRRHAEHFAAIADAAWEPSRSPATQAQTIARLGADRDNFRAALGWSLGHGRPDIALRITDTMWLYWWYRGESAEGRAWLDRSLAMDDGADPRRRARCLYGLAGLCWSLGDDAAAEPPANEALRLAEATGDDSVAAAASNVLGLLAEGREDFALAQTLFRASVEHNRVADLTPAVRARNIATAIDNLGSTALELGDYVDAERQYSEARGINVEAGDTEGVAMNDLHLSLIESRTGRPAEAGRRLHAALSVYVDLGFLHYAAECLDAAAGVANGLAMAGEAAFMLGASAHIRQELGNQPVPIMARWRDRESAVARASTGDEAFDTAYAEGLATPIHVATRRALDFLAG